MQIHKKQKILVLGGNSQTKYTHSKLGNLTHFIDRPDLNKIYNLVLKMFIMDMAKNCKII